MFFLQNKKKRKSKPKEVAGGGAQVAGGPALTPKNIQDILSKLTVEEKSKSHDFWDTQPVPKLGVYTLNCIRICVEYLLLQ